MAWEAYVYECLYRKQTKYGIYTNCCESAGIISSYDGQVWASTPNFGLLSYYSYENEEFKLTDEVHDILTGLKSAIKPQSLRINRKKYLLVKDNYDEHSVYLRRKGGGACIAMTNLLIIIATYNDTLSVVSDNEKFAQNPGLTNERVGTVAKHLVRAGF